MSDFWSWYLNERKPLIGSNVDILERSLTDIKNTTSADELSESTKRVYRLACNRCLDSDLEECLKHKKTSKKNEINTYSFSFSRALMFFNKSRSLIMSVAMLAMLIGLQLKGEFPNLVFAFILFILFVYLIKEVYGYYNDKLAESQVSKNPKADCYNEIITDALSKIKPQKNKESISFRDKQDHDKRVKYLFSKHLDENNKVQEVSQESSGDDVRVAKKSDCWVIFWNDCQDYIADAKSENLDHFDLQFEKINKSIEDKITAQKIDADKAVEGIREKRDAEITNQSNDSNESAVGFSSRRKIYEKYKAEISEIKNKSRQAVVSIKNDSKSKIKDLKSKSHKLNREINKQLPHIRISALEIFNKKLDGRDGIPSDEIDSFRQEIRKEFKESIERQLAPYHHSMLKNDNDEHGDRANA